MMKKVLGLSLVLGAMVVSGESFASAEKLSDVVRSEVELKDASAPTVTGDASALILEVKKEEAAPATLTEVKKEEAAPATLTEVKKEEAKPVTTLVAVKKEEKKNLMVRFFAAAKAKTSTGISFAYGKVASFFSAIWTWISEKFNATKKTVTLANFKKLFARNKAAQTATLKDATTKA